jgi:hypothetical protein
MKLVYTLAALAMAPIVSGSSFGISTGANNYLYYGCGQGTSYSTSGGAGSGQSTPQAGVTCSYTSNFSTPSGPGGVTATSNSSSNILDNGTHTDSVVDWATADLTTGQLHLYSSDINNFNGGNDNGTGNYAYAYLNDTLSFDNPSATRNTVWQVVATFEFDGTSTAGDQVIEHPPNSTYVVFNNFVGATAQWTVNSPGGSGTSCNNEGNSNVSFLACTATNWITVVTVNVTGPTATIPIGMGMNLASDGNDIADFSNTASVSFNLPAGTTYTSASGVFMTADTPEPGTFALAAAVLLALGLNIHRCGRLRRPACDPPGR